MLIEIVRLGLRDEFGREIILDGYMWRYNHLS